MYRCEQCRKVMPKGKVQMRIVVKTREVLPVFPGAKFGTETVKEIKGCPKCHKKYKKPKPKTKGKVKKE